MHLSLCLLRLILNVVPVCHLFELSQVPIFWLLIATDAHYFASYWNDSISNEMLIIYTRYIKLKFELFPGISKVKTSLKPTFRSVLLVFFKLFKKGPQCPSQGHKYGARKLTKTYIFEICYKKPVVVFWGLINIYMSTYSHTRTVQIAKSQRISHIFMHQSIPAVPIPPPPG